MPNVGSPGPPLAGKAPRASPQGVSPNLPNCRRGLYHRESVGKTPRETPLDAFRQLSCGTNSLPPARTPQSSLELARKTRTLGPLAPPNVTRNAVSTRSPATGGLWACPQRLTRPYGAAPRPARRRRAPPTTTTAVDATAVPPRADVDQGAVQGEPRGRPASVSPGENGWGLE